MHLPKLTVVLDEELHRAVRVACAERGENVSALVRGFLADWVSPGSTAAEPPRAAARTAAAAPEPRRATTVQPPAATAKPTPETCSRRAQHFADIVTPCPECGFQKGASG
jgi:hypothetical protein